MWQVNFNLANTLNSITIGNSEEFEGFPKHAIMPYYLRVLNI